MTYKQNPLWVNRILSKHWKMLSDTVGPDMMPVVARKTRTGKRQFEELGCGHYGCVLHTNFSRVVLKITSDLTEAAFVVAALSLQKKDNHWPDGMIRYHEIFELPETYRKRRVFAIWREEAIDVGFLVTKLRQYNVSSSYLSSSFYQLRENLRKFKDWAYVVRKYLKNAKDPISALEKIKRLQDRDFAYKLKQTASGMYLKGAEKAAYGIEMCEDIAEEMEHTFMSDAIGRALGYYLQQGILLADVHWNNVGTANRPPDNEYDDWYKVNVITDPGHMVPLDARWLNLEAPQLYGE